MHKRLTGHYRPLNLRSLDCSICFQAASSEGSQSSASATQHRVLGMQSVQARHGAVVFAESRDLKVAPLPRPAKVSPNSRRCLVELTDTFCVFGAANKCCGNYGKVIESRAQVIAETAPCGAVRHGAECDLAIPRRVCAQLRVGRFQHKAPEAAICTFRRCPGCFSGWGREAISRLTVIACLEARTRAAARSWTMSTSLSGRASKANPGTTPLRCKLDSVP